jgi:hypothetical protein
VRNPNPLMPDYKEHQMPYTQRDYIEAEGSPWENEREGGGESQAAGKGAL